MNLKMHEKIELYYELNGLSQVVENKNVTILVGALKQKMSLKNKMYLQRLNNLILEDIKLYEESKKELFEKLGKEESGNYTIPEENLAKFNKEQADLLSAEKEINVATLWGEDFTIDSLENIETEEVYPILFKVIENQT